MMANKRNLMQTYEKIEHEQLSLFGYSTPPDSFKSGDKVSGALTKADHPKPGESIQSLSINIGSKKNPIEIYADLDFTELCDRSGLTYIDIAVTDAVARLIDQGQMQFTAAQIIKEYRATPNKNPSPEQIKKMEARLDRLRFLPTTIEMRELYKIRGERERRDTALSSYWLPLEKTEQTIVNKSGEYTIAVYTVLQKPILTRYQEALAAGGGLQRLTYSKELLALPNKSQTDIRVIIGREMIDRIKRLINNKNSLQQTKIKLETLEQKVRRDLPKAKREHIVSAALDYLENFKDKNLIFEYKVIKSGKKIVAFRVKPNYHYKK